LAATAMVRLPQVLVNITLKSRRAIDEMPKLSALSDKVRKELGDEGRLLVRWSGTEAKLRIMLEGPDESRLRELANALADAAKKDTASS